ncbi:MAG: hypothetical protein XD95_0396, partial [Microgenomates bacterium 39_7]
MEGVNWDKTRKMLKRVRKDPNDLGHGFKRFFIGMNSENSFYQGRHIISRDKPINGGVYLGEGSREALVVDDTKDTQLKKIFSLLINRMGDKDPKTYLLRGVWELAREIIPYDENRVIKINQKLLPDQKIYLSSFFGGGVCRHQALLMAYLLEKCIQRGYLGGKVSVDRNSIDGLGGHAWVRYVTSAGGVIILDATQNFIG